MRELMEVTMPAAGVTPNPTSYQLLVRMMVVEGDMKGARDVVEREMPKVGLKPTEGTRNDALHTGNAKLHGMRSRALYKLNDAGVEGKMAATQLLAAMERHGVADDTLRSMVTTDALDSFNQQLEDPLSGSSHSSTAMRELMEVAMPAAGVTKKLVLITIRTRTWY